MSMVSEPGSLPKAGRTGSGRPKALSSGLERDKANNPSPSTVSVQAIPALLSLSEGSHWTEARTRALLSCLSDLVVSVSKEGVILEAHFPQNCAYGLSAQTLLGKRLMELLPVQIGTQAMHHLEKAVRTGRTQQFAAPYQVRGELRDFEVRITNSIPGQAVAVVRDVTVRKASEKEIIEITNREQMRIGQDLHDGLGQHLTGITFLSKALERKLVAKCLPEAEDAADIGRLVLQVLSQTRNLARGLFPVELEANGLLAAFRELATTIEKLFHISCEVQRGEEVIIPDPGVANHLFRLAQEAINNSVKHGKATKVVICLRAEGGQTVLAIRDNGIGVRDTSLPTKGLGMRIMHYRAQRIGAELKIEAAEGGGTMVTCFLPSPN